jgi:hypothetical protein
MGSIGIGSLVGYRGTVVGEVQRVKQMWERHYKWKIEFENGEKREIDRN